jgi:two-component system OmpR family response regulator
MTIDGAARVLVVDDDPTKGSRVVNYFKDSGLQAAHTSWRQLTTGQSKVEWFNMMILAFRIDQKGGFDLLRAIQSQTDSPAIIVADPQRDAMERVTGLELGADDYLTEPFALRESEQSCGGGACDFLSAKSGRITADTSSAAGNSIDALGG